MREFESPECVTLRSKGIRGWRGRDILQVSLSFTASNGVLVMRQCVIEFVDCEFAGDMTK